MNRQIKSIRTPPQTIMNKLMVFWNVSCSYIVVFLFLGGGSLDPLQGTSAEPKPVWVRQLRKDCTRQHTQHGSRVHCFLACVGFRSCSFNNILPQVQSIKVDAFLSSARFPKQSTIKVMVVNGMFFLSCRIKYWARVEINSVSLIDTFFVLFRSFRGRCAGLIVPENLF